MAVYHVIGAAHQPHVFFARHLLEQVERTNRGVSHTCDVLMECDYLARVDALRRQRGGFYHTHKDVVLVSKGSAYIGGLHQLVEHLQRTYDYTPMEELTDTRFMAESEAAMEHALSKLHSTVCFLKFGMRKQKEEDGDEEDTETLGRIVVELFNQLAPKACENFRCLCSGERGINDQGVKLHYENTPVHRVVPEGWMQFGDIVNGDGDNNESIWGGTFEDETLVVAFDKRGILGLANDGPHSNGSQAFITLGPCSFLNGSKVGIGRVLVGEDVLRKIESAELQFNQRPVNPIVITACGILRQA